MKTLSVSSSSLSFRALWALSITALFLVSFAWGPRTAHAENLIKRPGAHNHYAFEIEPHLNMHYYGQGNRAYFGPGVRVSIPFMHNGPIDTINNNMAITFGMDTYFPSGGYGIALPVAAQWNFYFTDIISVLGEVGIVTTFGSFTDFSPNLLDPYIQGGGRFQFGKVGVLVRIGYPSLSVGANFQF